MTTDELADRRAKDRAEYDEAARIVLWLKERAAERLRDGHTLRWQILSVAAKQIADSFLAPPAGAPEPR